MISHCYKYVNIIEGHDVCISWLLVQIIMIYLLIYHVYLKTISYYIYKIYCDMIIFMCYSCLFIMFVIDHILCLHIVMSISLANY